MVDRLAMSGLMNSWMTEVVAVVAVILVIVWYVRVASKPCVNPQGARNHPTSVRLSIMELPQELDGFWMFLV